MIRHHIFTQASSRALFQLASDLVGADEEVLSILQILEARLEVNKNLLRIYKHEAHNASDLYLDPTVNLRNELD